MSATLGTVLVRTVLVSAALSMVACGDDSTTHRGSGGTGGASSSTGGSGAKADAGTNGGASTDGSGGSAARAGAEANTGASDGNGGAPEAVAGSGSDTADVAGASSGTSTEGANAGSSSETPSTGGSSGGDTGTTGGSAGATSGSTDATGGSSGVETEIYLSNVCELDDAENGWGPIEKNTSVGEQREGDGRTLTINGTRYEYGLGVHAPSDVGYALGGACTLLTAEVGVDDEQDRNGNVIFEVWGDGERLYESRAKTVNDGPSSIEVDITGVDELRLVVDPNGGNGSDHADWGDLRVVCIDAPLAPCGNDTGDDTGSDTGSDTSGIAIPTGYKLVWSDEFDVDGRPNPDNWTYEHGFVRNNELQWYQEDNATVEGGSLVIEGRRESGSEGGESYNYTSSSLLTRGLQEWQYGRFEMRARIVTAAGLWPAWWTLGVSGGWPSCGEVDIMEFYNNRVHANVACASSSSGEKWDSANRLVSELGSNWDASFHIWQMDWDSEKIVLSLDEIEMNRITLDSMLNPNGQSPFRQPHYMLINLAIGGNAGGDPSSTAFPTRYEVDWVRVFQRE